MRRGNVEQSMLVDLHLIGAQVAFYLIVPYPTVNASGQRLCYCAEPRRIILRSKDEDVERIRSSSLLLR